MKIWKLYSVYFLKMYMFVRTYQLLPILWRDWRCSDMLYIYILQDYLLSYDMRINITSGYVHRFSIIFIYILGTVSVIFVFIQFYIYLRIEHKLS